MKCSQCGEEGHNRSNTKFHPRDGTSAKPPKEKRTRNETGKNEKKDIVNIVDAINSESLAGKMLTSTLPTSTNMTLTTKDLTALTTQVMVTLHDNPRFLKKTVNPTTLLKLQTQTNKNAQGTGNKVTEQEANFADLLEGHGLSLQPKEGPITDGLGYRYQVNGSQKEGDFSICLVYSGKVIKEIVCDLKHTLTKSFYLNDGWFQSDVIYIITWNAGTLKKPNIQVHIALGQDIPTEEEITFMKYLQGVKNKTNSEVKKVGSLRPYLRFANQYDCHRFLDTADKRYEHVKVFLSQAL